MLFPLSEVADMALAADIRCPPHINLHDRIIQPDRKQDETIVFRFLLKSPLYLLLDPLALDGAYLSCQFWGKASNFRGFFERLLYDVATI